MKHTFEQKETVIYGGAFNPPTRAHEQILQACVEYADEMHGDVWLLPSASRADKEIDVSIARRIALCEALSRDVIRGMVDVRVEDSELTRGVQTETYDTVQEFAAQYPERHFSWVFGSDSVTTMSEWHGGVWMRDNLSMLVVDRPGYVLAGMGCNAVRLAVAPMDTGSTELRHRIAKGEDYRELVGDEVAQVLASH
ncbi:nicotinate-nicotinamide nucleotide adenylyltransferase [Candidatus Saccharibacteria bacterium]|nr:nicotinate-nicotinamide nucleotide adenylyltransferase [Candidatus Saccharibacteria bacterium]